jgi:hypothetical protein
MLRACQVFAHRLLTFSRPEGCPRSRRHWIRLVRRSCRHATSCRRVCALSHVARVASLASFEGFAVEADIANQTHHAHAAWLATFAQSACHADQVDCARLALRAEESRSAEFASSANPTTGRLPRPGSCRDGRWSAGSGASVAPRCSLAITSQSSTDRPSPLPSDNGTCITHLLSPPSPPRAHASSTLIRTQLHR